jgi:hypothetical protein
VFDFVLVDGPTGPQGATGDAATITIGTIGTVAFPGPGTVTNSGTTGAAVLDFILVTGPQGAIGDLTAADPIAYVGSEFSLKFGAGLGTATGGTLVADFSDATPLALGTAAAGTAIELARGDHRHDMPSAADVGAVANSLIANSKGALITSTGSVVDDLPVGTDGHILTADSAQTLGIKWAAAPASGIAETLLDAKGDLIVATAADTAARLAVGTNGHALVADSNATAGVKWAGVGKVLQAVTASKTNTFSTSSTSFTTVTDVSVSITPSSTSSKILVIAMVPLALSSVNGLAKATVFRDSTNLTNASSPSSRTAGLVSHSEDANQMVCVSMTFLDSPSTTSSVTYDARVLALSGYTVYVNRTHNDTDSAVGTRGVATITALEIGP